MGTWNFRVVVKGKYYGIHYAHYNDEGILESLSVDPVSPVGEDIDELKEYVEMLLETFKEDTIVCRQQECGIEFSK